MNGMTRLLANLAFSGISAVYYILIAFTILTGTSVCSAESETMPKLWPGYAILGNGNICAVYSDYAGSSSKSTLRGIQHFYYRDYTADYIASTSFQVLDEANSICQKDAAHPDSVGMENFYTTFTKSLLAGGIHVESRAFAHPGDAIVLSFVVKGAPEGYSYRFRARLPRRMVTDETILLNHSTILAEGATFSWSTGTSLAIGTYSQDGWATMDDMGLVIQGNLPAGRATVIIAAGQSEQEALKKLAAIRREEHPSSLAAHHWQTWLAKGLVPELSDQILLQAYRRNLYAARAANLNGQIPADITGQFRTNNMPQLYPRDALMCARVFLLTGHLQEAGQVLDFWANRRIPRKSPGEWYARYDARGQAVDAGSGARYDEPEWDSNGYFIQLAETYQAKTGEWPVDPSFLFQLADFLVEHIEDNGLLYEGGIVEWSGYLPATNMTAAAALETAWGIAQTMADSLPEERYRVASQRISASLDFMFDEKRGTYADVRFAGRKGADNVSLTETTGDALYLWDTSANFGVLWGYPDHQKIRQSNEFYAEQCVKMGGGMQYFDAPDPGLSGYGHDLFFFTTAAAAQYQARYENPVCAKRHIDWMLANANVYGLMPERIYLNGSGCSKASPLSWCCAEFAAAVLEWSRTTNTNHDF